MYRPTQRKPHSLRRRVGQFFKLCALVVLAVIVVGSIAGCIMYQAWIVHGDLPNVIALIDQEKPDEMSIITGIDLDPIDGHEFDVQIGRIYKQRTMRIPTGADIHELIASVKAAEDANFDNHDGVDVIAFIKACLSALKTHHLRGASTITMQLVKSYIGNERTAKRKVKEWYLAYRLEKDLTQRYGSKAAAKEWIMKHYCDRAYIGHGGYGFELAAHSYFNVSAANLTTLQAAAIASLAKGAEKYTVLSGASEEITASRVALHNRVNYVLGRRMKTGTLSATEFNRLAQEPMVFTPPRYEPGVCAEYVALVEKKLRTMYAKDLGSVALDVRTTCIIPYQRAARKLLEEHLGTIDSVNGQLPRPQGTLVIVENDTGRTIAIIGGDNYQAGDLVRAIESERQPGSAAKILLFLAALEMRYLPSDAFPDGLTTIPPLKKGGKPWQPRNAHEVSGKWQTLRYTFNHSLNTIAAQLIYDMGKTAGNPFAGIEAMSDVAKRLNFSTPVIDEYSAALGVFGVHLVDLAGAVAAISHHGEYVEPHFLTHVREKNSVHSSSAATTAGWQTKEIYRDQAFTPQVAYLMWTMLRSVVTDGTGIRAKSFPLPVGGKTGTSQANRDTNFTGSSQKYTVSIWMGFDKPADMSIDRRTGKEIQGASNVPLFVKLMKMLYPTLPKEAREEPPGLLHLKTVLEKYPDDIYRPRCATPDDAPETVTEDLYLPQAVPDGCPPELMVLAKPRPRQFGYTPVQTREIPAELPIVTLPVIPPPVAAPEPIPSPVLPPPPTVSPAKTLPTAPAPEKEPDFIKEEGSPEDFEP